MSDFKQVLPHVEAAVRAGVEVPAEHVAPLLAELKRLRDGRETEPAPVDWPARFRAAGDAAGSGYWDEFYNLADSLEGLAPHRPDLVEAIGRALIGETK